MKIIYSLLVNYDERKIIFHGEFITLAKPYFRNFNKLTDDFKFSDCFCDFNA